MIIGRESNDISLAVANEAFVDFSNGEMGFYKASSTQDTEREVYLSTVIDFEIIEKHQYTIRFVKEDGLRLKLILTDDFAGESVRIEGSTVVAGCGWGKRKFECVSGTINLIDFYNLNTQPSNPKVLIMGDSYIEGNYLNEEKDKRYAKLDIPDVFK